MLGDFNDNEIEYRSVEPWAIVGLLLGFLSPVALLGRLLLLVPPLGILINAIALRRVARDSNRIGRASALIGLGLSVLFAVAPMAQMTSNFLLLRPQARPVADKFFEYLRQGQPERAVTLRVTPDLRQTLEQQDSEGLWTFYRNNEEARSDLKSLVRLPVTRTLLALGDRADIRFYRTVALGTSGDEAKVEYWYTVTCVDDTDKKKTFLVGIVLERKATKNPELSPWRVAELYGPVNPSNLRKG